MPQLKRVIAGLGDPRVSQRWFSALGYVLLTAGMLLASKFLFTRLGGSLFAVALAGTLAAAIYTVISFRYLAIPYYIWILSVGGFRFLWSIQTPLLPDLYLDRMAMAWLAIVFMIKFVAERQRLVGPFKLDILILLHGLYILAQVYILDMTRFHDWTMSILVPYSAFYLTKNIVTSNDRVRTLLWVILALSIYYNVTAVAEKYHINWLIWPKYIITIENEFLNRSQGPFMQAPLFGTVIGMLLPVHLYFLATVKQPLARMLLGLSLLVGMAGLYFTYTRGSWLAGIVALGATVALNRRAYLRFVAPALIVAPIVAIGVLGLAEDKFMKERVSNEDTIGSRLGTAVTVMRVWRDHPLFGVGFYQFNRIREHYVEPVQVPGMPPIRFNQFRNNPIHDIYLGPLAESGLVGTAMQAGIYFLILRAFLRVFARRHEGDHFATYMMPVFGGLMCGYMVGGLAIDYRFFSVVGTMFLCCAAIIYAYPVGQTGSVVSTAPAASRVHQWGLGRVS
jgi:O-antigen ligase